MARPRVPYKIVQAAINNRTSAIASQMGFQVHSNGTLPSLLMMPSCKPPRSQIQIQAEEFVTVACTSAGCF